MNKYHHFQELADHQRPFLRIGICSPNQQACYSVADVSDHVLSPHWLPKCLYLLLKNQCGFFLQNSHFAPSVKQDCDMMSGKEKKWKQRIWYSADAEELIDYHRHIIIQNHHKVFKYLPVEKMLSSRVKRTFICIEDQIKFFPRTLIVIGLSTVPEVASIMPFIRIGFVRRQDPAPLLTTMSIGQPMLISMKSTVHCWSISSTVRARVSGYAPHICTPNKSSDECRLSRAHSEACPYSHNNMIVRKWDMESHKSSTKYKEC